LAFPAPRVRSTASKPFTAAQLRHSHLNFPLLSAPTRKVLFRSYDRFFAEFLNEGSLVHLRLLASPTCVGFRYGSLSPQRCIAAEIRNTKSLPAAGRRIFKQITNSKSQTHLLFGTFVLRYCLEIRDSIFVLPDAMHRVIRRFSRPSRHFHRIHLAASPAPCDTPIAK